MYKIGIMGAMEVEIELLKLKLHINEEKVFSGFIFYIGKFNDLDVVLCSCGVGKVNAASCTQVLIDKFNVTHIINTGIAGSLNNDVKLGDIVISTSVTYHDVRQRQMKNLFPFKEEFMADEFLVNISKNAFNFKELKGVHCHKGKIVTGEAFIDNNYAKEQIVKAYSPLCVEMEGGAIGHVSYINNVPFVILRSISDNADDDARENYDNFERDASNTSANLVERILNLLSQPKYIEIDSELRLRKADKNYDFALSWYKDLELVKLVDGPLAQIYDKDKLSTMYSYLMEKGELYFIEIKENEDYKPIGDVTLFRDDMPIVIGDCKYRGKGIGEKVIKSLIKRGIQLGYTSFGVKEIYSYNLASQKCFEKVGFKKDKATEKGYSYIFTIDENDFIQLRYPEVEDAEAFYEILSEGNFPYYYSTIPESIELERKWIEGRKNKRESRDEFNYTILYHGKVVGGCEIRLFKDDTHIGEIGYFIDKDYFNRGIASSAVKKLEKIAFYELKLKRLEIRMDPRNRASEKVAIKNGFKKEGVLNSVVCFKGKYYNNLLYVKINNEI